jgi:aryl-alcohol dehydrogenase-like predicted oxidoreductase
MKTRALGATGIRVSSICLGTGQMTWTTPAPRAFRLLDQYAAAGGNFIDTADIYTQWVDGHTGGESETIVGQWLARRKNRRAVFLATKCRGRMWSGPAGEGLNRAHIIQACEDSLRRLKTDHIDLYQSHWYDDATPIGETLRAYADLIRAGKVRYIGASNFSAAQLTEAVLVARQAGLPQYVAYQPFYNLPFRELEAEHVWVMERYGIGCIPYTPIGQGFLSGKYRANKPLPKTSRSAHVKSRYFSEKNFKIVETLEKLGRKRGKTIVQMALGWHLGHAWVTAPIIGPNTPEQLAENLGASDLELSAAEMTALNEVSK